MSFEPPNYHPDDLEVKLTALLLGELPPEEAAALLQAMEQDAELARLHAQLKATIELVRETAADPAQPAPAQSIRPQLSAAKRERLLAEFKTVRPPAFRWRALAREWGLPTAMAAGFIALLALGAMLAGGERLPLAKHSVSFSLARPERVTNLASGADSSERMVKPSQGEDQTMSEGLGLMEKSDSETPPDHDSLGRRRERSVSTTPLSTEDSFRAKLALAAPSRASSAASDQGAKSEAQLLTAQPKPSEREHPAPGPAPTGPRVGGREARTLGGAEVDSMVVAPPLASAPPAVSARTSRETKDRATPSLRAKAESSQRGLSRELAEEPRTAPRPTAAGFEAAGTTTAAAPAVRFELDPGSDGDKLAKGRQMELSDLAGDARVTLATPAAPAAVPPPQEPLVPLILNLPPAAFKGTPKDLPAGYAYYKEEAKPAAPAAVPTKPAATPPPPAAHLAGEILKDSVHDLGLTVQAGAKPASGAGIPPSEATLGDAASKSDPIRRVTADAPELAVAPAAAAEKLAEQKDAGRRDEIALEQNAGRAYSDTTAMAPALPSGPGNAPSAHFGSTASGTPTGGAMGGGMGGFGGGGFGGGFGGRGHGGGAIGGGRPSASPMDALGESDQKKQIVNGVVAEKKSELARDGRAFPNRDQMGDAYISIDPETRRVFSIADADTTKALSKVLSDLDHRDPLVAEHAVADQSIVNHGKIVTGKMPAQNKAGEQPQGAFNNPLTQRASQPLNRQVGNGLSVFGEGRGEERGGERPAPAPTAPRPPTQEAELAPRYQVQGQAPALGNTPLLGSLFYRSADASPDKAKQAEPEMRQRVAPPGSAPQDAGVHALDVVGYINLPATNGLLPAFGRSDLGQQVAGLTGSLESINGTTRDRSSASSPASRNVWGFQAATEGFSAELAEVKGGQNSMADGQNRTFSKRLADKNGASMDFFGDVGTNTVAALPALNRQAPGMDPNAATQPPAQGIFWWGTTDASTGLPTLYADDFVTPGTPPTNWSETVNLYDLKNADAEDVQQAIKGLFSRNYTRSNRSPQALDKQSIENRIDLSGEFGASGLVQGGKQLSEMGKLDEAETKFKAARQADPNDQTAYDGLNRVSESRFNLIQQERAVNARQNIARAENGWMLPPQGGTAGAPVNESVLRQQTLVLLRQKIAEARTAHQRGDSPAAANLYDEAYNLWSVAGPVAAAEGNEVKAGLATTRLELAKSAMGRDDHTAAKKEIEDLLRVDPANTDAIKLRQEAERPARARPADAPQPQPEVQTSENAFSTFSLNISDVSFKLAAASLEKGVMPGAANIRSEEFINAFNYRDPDPAPGVPIGFAWERSAYPFAQNRDLLRFAIRTAAQGRQADRPLNIVLLLDHSGSMERADRVAIIREALRILASQLQPQDKLSIVTFARTPQLRADGVSGPQAQEAAARVSEFTPEGGTNLEEAMKLAYETALRHYLTNGVNRVVLLTDGAANLGTVDPEALQQRVETNRKQGIALDCFGIGWEGYNDDLLELLTRHGDGRYGFVNTPEEAATGFAAQLAGALEVAASDMKVQVEFNPERVTAYRQIGYAKHQLTKEQFRDNTVNAAQIASAESGNALYVVAVNPAGRGPLATVHARYRIPGTQDYREHEWEVPFTGNAAPLDQASPALRLAAVSAAFSEWLAVSPFATEIEPGRLVELLRGVPEIYGADQRPRKLEWMIRQAQSLQGK